MKQNETVFLEHYNFSNDGTRISIECLDRNINHSGSNNIYNYHDHLEIIFCTEGMFELKGFGETHTLTPGDMIFISSHIPHGINYITETSHHICIKFDPLVISLPDDKLSIIRVNSILSEMKRFEFFKNEDLQSDFPKIEILFKEMLENYRYPYYHNSLMLRGNIQKLMAYIISIRCDSHDNAHDFSHLPIVNEVINYIHNNLSTASLAEAAKISSMSYSYISKIFTNQMGVSFSKYLIQEKINKSMDLLINTDKSITEISTELGFSSTSHFIKDFRGLKGVTPHTFRKSSRYKTYN